MMEIDDLTFEKEEGDDDGSLRGIRMLTLEMNGHTRSYAPSFLYTDIASIWAMRATAISRHHSTELYLTEQEARDGATYSSLRLHMIADASVRCAAYEAHVEDVMPSTRFHFGTI
jgi:hypothetical protein